MSDPQRYVWVVWDYPTGQRLNIVDTQDKADYEITRYRGQGYDPTYEMVIMIAPPTNVATPSDPHSAEAEARYPIGLHPWVDKLQRAAFIAGRVSRDAEVAELKAKIAAAVARLNAASIPPMMTEAQFNATTITDARRILLGSASSPVEGRPHDN